MNVLKLNDFRNPVQITECGTCNGTGCAPGWDLDACRDCAQSAELDWLYVQRERKIERASQNS